MAAVTTTGFNPAETYTEIYKKVTTGLNATIKNLESGIKGIGSNREGVDTKMALFYATRSLEGFDIDSFTSEVTTVNTQLAAAKAKLEQATNLNNNLMQIISHFQKGEMQESKLTSLPTESKTEYTNSRENLKTLIYKQAMVASLVSRYISRLPVFERSFNAFKALVESHGQPGMLARFWGTTGGTEPTGSKTPAAGGAGNGEAITAAAAKAEGVSYADAVKTGT